MEIYIESFLIQNTVINFCLLKLICLTLKPKTKTFKMLLASIVGAVLSTVSVVVQNTVVSTLLGIICPILMLKMAFKQRKKQFVFSFALFYLFGFTVLGGLAILGEKLGKINNNFSSLELLSIITILVSYIFESVVKKIKFKIKTNNLIYPITLSLNKQKIKINAFLDTGNLLSYNCQPVVVVDLDAYLALSKTDLMSFYLKKGEQINLGTVAGANAAKIFKIDYMQVEVNGKIKTFNGQYIAVNALNSFKNTNYQALITPQLI